MNAELSINVFINKVCLVKSTLVLFALKCDMLDSYFDLCIGHF